MTTTSKLNRALTCTDEGVRFGAYNGHVSMMPVPESTTSALTIAAAEAVAR